MNRRDLLKGMLAMPALAVLAKCQQKSKKYSDHQPESTKLAVILQGPYVVMIQKNKAYRVAAFVPKTDPQDTLSHEFRFLSPYQDPVPTCATGYHFELLAGGLQTIERAPTVNRDFNDVSFSVDQWAPRTDDYSIFLDMPAPDAINYIPSLYPALFNSDTDPHGRLTSVPLNHVLEYTVRDEHDLWLQPTNMERCTLPEKKNSRGYAPLSTSKMWEEYQSYRKEWPDQAVDPAHSQRPYVARWLERFSHVFFLGVGVRLEREPEKYMKQREDHAVNFFNKRLLPAIFQHEKIPDNFTLRKVGKDALPCDTESSISSMPQMRPAVWQSSTGRAHIYNVSVTENCSCPGATCKTP